MLPPRLVETGPAAFALSGFLDRTWTLRITDLRGDTPAGSDWIREVRTASPAEVEVVYRNPAEAFDRSAGLKQLRTVIDLPSAAKYARKNFQARAPQPARLVDGAVVHRFDVEHSLEGGPGSVLMLEVADLERWILFSAQGAEIIQVRRP